MAYFLRSRSMDYAIFGLSVFLVFCLIFESYIELPVVVAWVGRWHPLVLHFPIVLLLIAIFLGLTGKKVPPNLLSVAVLSALLTAISGFFLGKETLVKGDLLFWHQWLGGSVALIAALWYALERPGSFGNTVFSKGVQAILVVLIGFTGHYGGMVTHGEDFLALPMEKRQEKIPENPIIYKDVVARILDDKCVSCHNPNKQKGELLMTDLSELLEGGESGHTVVPGDPGESELIKRVLLPADDEDHMPPEGKTPLEANEIQILERWIALGASDTLRLDQLGGGEPLVNLIKGLMEPDAAEKWADLPKVPDSTLRNLSSDYLTIERVAGSSDALSVDVYLPPEYDPKRITDLARVAQNIVELDLSGLPLGPGEIDMIAACNNLEWLEVDRTPIGDPEMEKLKALENVKFLKIYGTQISDRSIAVLKGLPNLKSLYLWQTNISKSGLEDLQSSRTDLKIDYGIDEETRASFVAADSVSKTEKNEIRSKE